MQVLRKQIIVIDERFKLAYGTPVAELGNKQDPLDEAVYIILTFQTGISRAQAVWNSLKRYFPRWEDVETASEEQLANVLRDGGLHRQKARAIKRLLAGVRELTGELSLGQLSQLEEAEAEHKLCKLSGLSWKGARCVMLYGMGRQRFPVDVNTFRVFRRMGLIPRNSVYRRLSLHNKLECSVPPERRLSLHVNLVIHGEHICLPARPKCSICVVKDMCETGITGVPSNE